MVGSVKAGGMNNFSTLFIKKQNLRVELTDIDESAWRALAELLRLVRQSHFDDARNVTRWRLDADGVRCHQLSKHKAVNLHPPGSVPFSQIYLAPDEHGTEDDLQSVEEVVSDDDDSGAARGPTFARADGFDAWGGRKGRIHA